MSIVEKNRAIKMLEVMEKKINVLILKKNTHPLIYRSLLLHKCETQFGAKEQNIYY